MNADFGCRLAWADDRWGDKVYYPKACDEMSDYICALVLGWSLLFSIVWVFSGLWRCMGPWLQGWYEDFQRFEPPAGLA